MVPFVTGRQLKILCVDRRRDRRFRHDVGGVADRGVRKTAETSKGDVGSGTYNDNGTQFVSSATTHLFS